MSADAINTKYDVAISFLYGDLALASALNEKLANGLRTPFKTSDTKHVGISMNMQGL